MHIGLAGMYAHKMDRHRKVAEGCKFEGYGGYKGWEQALRRLHWQLTKANSHLYVHHRYKEGNLKEMTLGLLFSS